MILRKVVFILGFILVAYRPLYAQTKDSLISHTDTLQRVEDSLVKTNNFQQPDTTHHQDTTHIVNTTSPKDSVVSDTSKHIVIDTGKVQSSAATTNGYVINGRVEDNHTGEGIPFATVLLVHSSVGTVADLNGNFTLKSSVFKDTLRVQAIGYARYDYILKKDKHEYNLIAELGRATKSLNEFVLHAGEDPAILLVKHIISRKPYNNPDKTENYKYESYNKLELDVDRLPKSQFMKIPILKKYGFIYNNFDSTTDKEPFLPIYMTETLSEYYFRKHPKKQREFIKGSYVKGIKNQSITKYLGSLYQNVNIYKNFIPVFDLRFVSPISNEALLYYKYKIKDTEQAYGHNIILVEFEPRRDAERCFSGDFWVVDSMYAIQRMNMEVPKVANIDWVKRVNLYQEFAPVNDTLWFCIKDKFVASFSAYDANIFGVIGRKTTTYHNIIVNDTSVTRVLDDKQWKEDVIVSDSAREKDDEWWASHRPDSLNRDEKGIYKMIDTIDEMPVTKAIKKTVKFLASGVIDVGPIQLGPYYYLYSYNTIEGNRFRISLGTPYKLKDMHFSGYLAYGDKDQAFKYGLTGLWLLNRKPRSYVYASYIHDIDHSTNYYDQAISADNIFSSLFRKPGIPYKLAFADESRFEYFKEYYSGFSHKLTVIHRDFTPFAPLPVTGIFTDDNGQPSNSVINTELNLKLRFAYKEKFYEGQYLRVSLGSRYPIAELELGVGLKSILNSGYDYQKIRFSVSNTVKIPPAGSLYYNIFAGKYLNTNSLPYPLLEIHPGNEYLYYNMYAFEMMNEYEFVSDQYLGINLEHDIGGGVFNYIPGLKRLKLRQFWTAKAIIGSLSDANELLNFNKGYPFRSLQGNPYVELGTGVSN
ncbi:MAG TPA: DUF5686 family protein, partial [Flavipsychrobacter sp.]|nr:DUF5686 family protein [Flavipsychrobacter sp.]